MKRIARESYLQRLQDCAGTPDIKVLTGIAGAGKSTLLEDFSARRKEEKPETNIIQVDLRQTDAEDLMEYHRLKQYVQDHYREGVPNVVLIEEVQRCEGFEKALISLQAGEKYDLYVTSSCDVLSGSNPATLFVGHTVSVPVFPFSFSEYLSCFPSKNVYAALTVYLHVGGMAGTYDCKTPKERADDLQAAVLKPLLSGIVRREKIRHAAVLGSLIDYLEDNIGMLTSVRKISDALHSADHKTVGNYLDDLCRSFLFLRVPRYDIHSRRVLQSGEKYYLADPGFFYCRPGTHQMDFGRLLENAVAVELTRRGYQVYAGVLYKQEISFVAVRGGKKMYLQVACFLSGPEMIRKHAEPLLKIRDGYPKCIIARTYQPESDYEGIRIVDAAEWLSGLHD